MPKRRLILFIASLILLAGFFLLPGNKVWGDKVISYWKEFQTQRKNTGKENRLIKRFGNDYTFSTLIAGKMKKNGQQDALVLMPPTNYFTKAGLKYHVPEPAVFYYFTGVKTVWANSKEAINADWYVRVHDGKILLSKGNDKPSLQDTIAAFQKLGVTL
jgi:hypothetical protein